MAPASLVSSTFSPHAPPSPPPPPSSHLFLNSTPLRPSLFTPLLTISKTFTGFTFTASLLLHHLLSPPLPLPSLLLFVRRRIYIGLSLLSDPSILLLHEPTSTSTAPPSSLSSSLFAPSPSP
ncbi:P-loop containing nucleoside triphosphate hydrolase protein [Dioscorea alata]|uniref:P-loop containing nucleoside triphosphate hydrolase protein n=1 Tax=Dioscorea alata TaxID=55571 RepID=A0ACB7WUE7_DIOAL|nr:P-loop containing nucleoside triphosphate hydrolase protein [Dioscorea alata]